MKTIRFSKVVEKAGKPEIHLAWIQPGRDARMKQALQGNRVMTVHQELRGGKKDYGLIGYRKEPNSQILIFQKSLRRFAERRVVAIDYSLVERSGLVDGTDSRPKSDERHDHSRFVSKARSSRVPAAEDHQPAVAKKHWTLADILLEVKTAQKEITAGDVVQAGERLQRILLSTASRRPKKRSGKNGRS